MRRLPDAPRSFLVDASGRRLQTCAARAEPSYVVVDGSGTDPLLRHRRLRCCHSLYARIVKRKPQRPPKARAAPIKVRAGLSTSFATAGCKKRGSRASRQPKSCSRCITNPDTSHSGPETSASLAALFAPLTRPAPRARRRPAKNRFVSHHPTSTAVGRRLGPHAAAAGPNPHAPRSDR